MTQVVVADLVTGRRYIDIPFSGLRWSNRRNAAGVIDCTLNLWDPDVRALDIRNITTPGKTLIGVLEGDTFMECGPLWRRRYMKSSGTLRLGGEGMLSIFRRRTIIPANALTDPLIIDDEANPATNSTWSGFDLGTIMKKAVQQALTVPGGSLPIVFEVDRAGTHEETILGTELKSVASFLTQKQQVLNGPDFQFRPRWTADMEGIEFLFRTGTQAEPRLRSSTIHLWNYAVEEPSIDDLVAEDSAEDLTTDAWASGGRLAGEALFAHERDTDAITAGFPMLEDVDASFSTVSEGETIQDHAIRNLADQNSAMELMPFRVRVDGRVGSYLPGDDCSVVVEDDPFYPDGTYTRVIETLSGDQDGRWIDVTTTEAPSGT